MHAIVVAYGVAVFALALLLDRGGKFVPHIYAASWLQVLLGAIAPGLGVAVLLLGFVENRSAPLPGVVAVLRRRVTPRFVAGLILFTSVTVFYGIFTSAKNLLPDLGPFTWDPAFAEIDAWMHGGIDPWRLVHPILSPVTRIVDFFYNGVWHIMMLGMIFVMSISGRNRIPFFLVFFLCWIVLGNVLAGIFYSAGPVFYDRVVGDASRFEPLMRYLAGYKDPPLNVTVFEAYLWALHRDGRAEFGSGISAFPSMHVAVATLVALWMTGLRRVLALPALAMLMLTQLGSVHLGWHYAVDGYVSIIVTLGAWWGVHRVAARRARDVQGA